MGTDARAYWESRLEREYSLGGVGWIGLGEAYNRWMYRVRRDAFGRVARPLLSPAARVLDVGSGTGFYVGLWHRLGAASVTGSDLTEVAVAHLSQRFPGTAFHRYELGAGDVAPIGPFDVISVMDVLFHITDDAQYCRGLSELRSLLEPDGRLILTENFAPRDELRAAHQVSRTGDAIAAAIAQAGLTIVTRRPMFVLMNSPAGGHSRLAERWWRLVQNGVTRGERAGAVLGAALYPAELAATRIRGDGPSTQIVVCRRT